MMGGLDTPTSGNVIVRDKELSKMNDEQLTICLLYTSRVERQHAFVLERAAIIRAAPQLVDMLRFGTIPLIGCVIAKLQRQNLTITVQRVVDPPALRPNRHGSLPAFSVINAAGGLWGQVRLPQRILADIAQKVVSA